MKNSRRARRERARRELLDLGDGAKHEALVQERRIARMEYIDDLPAGIRALVHEYGYTVVDQFLALGVTNPRHIKHLVETVLDEFSPTRGSGSFQGDYRGQPTHETDQKTTKKGTP